MLHTPCYPWVVRPPIWCAAPTHLATYMVCCTDSSGHLMVCCTNSSGHLYGVLHRLIRPPISSGHRMVCCTDSSGHLMVCCTDSSGHQLFSYSQFNFMHPKQYLTHYSFLPEPPARYATTSDFVRTFYFHVCLLYTHFFCNVYNTKGIWQYIKAV